jgi:hypothetical protein
MKPLRLLLADRLNGGVLAALLIYALLVQSVVGGMAFASGTEAHLAQSGIDCVASGPINRDHDGGHRLHECCAALCQIGCGAGTGFLPDTIRTCLGQAHVANPAAPVIACADSSRPRRLGIRRDARAPPHRSA